ncbi:FAD-dependent oxidoreductase [Amycolatopsis sp. H6(2020)]|nr:FAD-dependent oxidoreductase [Amycolatopsis sp. H6(2020)]
MATKVLVVGASLGGLRAAEQLRAAGWAGDITVVGEEPLMPYNRPPLSKDVLANRTEPPLEVEHVGLAFRVRKSLDDVTWKLGVSAKAADLGRGTVALSDGSHERFAGLVVATGLRPRRLALPGPEAGRHVVRTLEDARRLRTDLVRGARVVVVGGGFIGCEVAATAIRVGCRVTVVEPAAVPMGRPLGSRVGRVVQRYHESAGVTFHVGRAVVAIEGAQRVVGVELDEGSRLGADVVVEAIGARPNVEWLAGNGLDLSDGVLCDNHLRVEGLTNVVAVGDIARFPNPTADGVPRRVEHWGVPADTAKRAGRTLVDALSGRMPDLVPFAPIPSFWSDQFDLRIQGFGAPVLADKVEVLEGDLDSGSLRAGVVIGYLKNDRLVGVGLINLPARAAYYRDAVAAATTTAAA